MAARPIHNVHSVRLGVSPSRAGALLDTLGGDADVLWPGERWPPMRIDGVLRVGAEGHHGPVRYTVEAYVPSVRVCFRFREPPGFVGTHTFEVFPEAGGCRLEHRVEMTPSGLARLAWPLVFGPLHDALAEDAVSRARVAVGEPPGSQPWSAWVRLLRGVGAALERVAGRPGEGTARGS